MIFFLMGRTLGGVGLPEWAILSKSYLYPVNWVAVKKEKVVIETIGNYVVATGM